METDGLFPLTEPDSDSDSKPYSYIVLCSSFSTTHFREGSPSQGQISVPITYISIRGSESESEPVEKSYIVEEFESESGNGNKP